jgi:hypothetical protein
MLLALASAVFLGSEFLGTRYHILPSQISDFSFVASYDSQGHGGVIRPRLHTEVSCNQSQSQNHITTDGQSVSLGVEPPSGAHDQIFIAVWQLQSCYCGAASLTRGRVCLLSESLPVLVSHLL